MSDNNLVYSTATGRIEQPKESKPSQWPQRRAVCRSESDQDGVLLLSLLPLVLGKVRQVHQPQCLHYDGSLRRLFLLLLQEVFSLHLP